ncbi:MULTISPECIES: flavin monoamine oxidase family protein [Pseudoalteromonas]|uniref:Monoamine oxidase n=1 Tax=Pseudoalteromonas aurantia 208 TaxID=1314867 RepID=A0ABR9E797_9GAMM|nr:MULTISPECIES: FAD-dependent oxidoreductase [Pseudoalteromonas]MBE0366867.1 monoamine oxidase [Pseudoalteromonas aurantia 208]MBQ4847019.1 FAD-dependent oxidoreductase [Pseudoalteromonas sp. MMG005]
MAEHQSRAQFHQNNPQAKAHAALDDATNLQLKLTPGPVKLSAHKYQGKTAVIIGAGVSGLTTAYELLAQKTGMDVVVLEAQNRTGGRCLSLRTGDTLTEDVNSDLFNSTPGQTQMVHFEQPKGDSRPYLNAGPGRIPSGHKRLLSYLKEFGVDVEVYVMNSESNLVQMKDSFAGLPLVYRRLDHNTRGWLAQMVYENAHSLIKATECGVAAEKVDERAGQLQDLMISFGELVPSGEYKGKYQVTAGENGMENGRSRAGYTVLPGVEAGRTAEPLSFDSLLESNFWAETKFYQPADFLWQNTLFQPVGGMDQVQHAFAREVSRLGGNIQLNSPVKCIQWDESRQQFDISVSKMGTEAVEHIYADYCFSNMAMPFLSKILDDDLQSLDTETGLDKSFKQALHAVYQSQFNVPTQGYAAKFLACTTKVGWQADRSLWQGSSVEVRHDNISNEDILTVPDSEVGVVPIFGGISWTNDEITQIWYPSTAYHDQKGVLTGAYNFSKVAFDWGCLSVQERLDKAKAGATLFGDAFGHGLEHGVAIAWQNMPYIKGGWAQWHVVGDQAVTHFNALTQGSGINSAAGKSAPNFFVIGDQLSSLPGWQEGAIAAALNAVSRMERPDLAIPHLSYLPDTRLMVEGI